MGGGQDDDLHSRILRSLDSGHRIFQNETRFQRTGSKALSVQCSLIMTSIEWNRILFVV